VSTPSTNLRRAAISAAALVILALPAAGCGGGGSAPAAQLPGPALQILSRSDVAKYAAGTPQRALLQWWRDVQYSNLTGYLNAFQPSVRQGLAASANTGAGLRWFSGAVQTVRPSIVDTEQHGSRVVIYTNLDTRTPVGARHYVTSTRAQAFAFVKKAGVWKLADDSFVQSSLPANLQTKPTPSS
jgi:hypothetical protein